MKSVANRLLTARLPAAILVVAVLTGCATGAGTAPDYAADALQSGSGTFKKVALVADPTPPEIETVYFGMTPEDRAALQAGEGALGGAGYGFAACGQFLKVPLDPVTSSAIALSAKFIPATETALALNAERLKVVVIRASNICFIFNTS